MNTVVCRQHTSGEAPRVGGQLCGDGHAISRPVFAGVRLEKFAEELLAASVQPAGAYASSSQSKSQQPLVIPLSCALAAVPCQGFLLHDVKIDITSFQQVGRATHRTNQLCRRG